MVGLPVVAALLALLSVGSYFIGDELEARQVFPIISASFFILVFLLLSRKLTDNQFSYFLAFILFCVLEPMLLVQNLYSNQYLLLINHVLAITLTSLSISWRTMLIGFGLLTGADIIIHQFILNLSRPAATEVLFSNVSILLGAGILAVRIHTVHKQADLAYAIETLALTDSLTGIANRRGLTKHMGELKESWRQLPFTITLLDINYLKKINDEFGHDIGDSVISLVADVVRDNLLPDQIAGRIGGDEFMIIGVDELEKRKKQCLRIEGLVTQSQIKNLDLDVSVTCGSSSVDLTSAEFDDLLKAADKELYLKKKSRS
jgi:diguanylate cyclase (GGDEF)-like protein